MMVSIEISICQYITIYSIMKKSFYKYLFALFIGCFLVGCNHDEDTLSIIDESTDSVLAAAPDYEYRTILYLNICDEEKNSLCLLKLRI